MTWGEIKRKIDEHVKDDEEIRYIDLCGNFEDYPFLVERTRSSEGVGVTVE